MVNPFGEKTSGSKYEWMAKYESEKNRADALQYRISELNQVIQQYEDALNQLLRAKEELETDNGYLRNMLNESQMRLEQLQGKGISAPTGDSSLKAENEALRQEVAELKNQLARVGTGVSTEVVVSVPADLNRTLIPMMCLHFNPEDDRFENGYRDFVEAVINNGDTEMKIIGNLIKHGGSGPIEKLREVVPERDFDFALDQLQRNGLVKVINNEVNLGVASEEIVMSESEWMTMSVPELLDTLSDIASNSSDNDLVIALEKFRDAIQTKDIPATTIFFAIRKTIEGIQRGSLSRGEVLKTIEEWRKKLL